MLNRIVVMLFFTVALIGSRVAVHADPCGMVPPIYPAGQQTPIARVGLQQTYVSYKDGVETFVIRPGFTGKVDEFGMLIPFPTPPAIRKVPDHIFPHLAAAVDPPEVLVDLRRRLYKTVGKSAQGKKRKASKEVADGLKYDDVKVLKKEAVGMYEVAVLAAGSAQALKKWMDEHGFQFPDGMDDVCEEYIAQKWCFVAVKTKVGKKQGADPRPGQRQVDIKLPTGATFDGHVQGMGFRFESDELVVPMRLSAFNDGELRNIVYLMTDKPQKIRSIPEEYVVRQVAGTQLIKNVTDPLPLRIIGGSEKDIPEYRRRTLPAERNPVPRNGAARDLFATDMLAAKTKQLSLPHEEQEKVLLRIGERFGLRGAEIDKLNGTALAESREAIVKTSLVDLKEMTLSVIDGDFPRELIAQQNLKFAEYRMPNKRNNSASYDAKTNKPAAARQGILKVGALAPLNQNEIAQTESSFGSGFRLGWLISAMAVAFVGAVLILRLRGNAAK